MAENKLTGSAINMLSLIIIRSLKVRFQQVLVVFAALMVGAAIITAMAGVYFDINTKMSQELRTFGANFYIGPGQGTSLSNQTYDNIVSKIPDSTLVATSPYLYGVARTELQKVILLGVDFSHLNKLVPYWQVKGKWINVGFDERHAMIGATLASQLELKVGDTITLTNNAVKHKLIIRGIVESGEAIDNYLIVNISLAQSWLKKPNEVNYALFSLENNDEQVSHLAQSLYRQYPKLEVRPIRKVSASEGKVLEKIKGLMGLVTVVILILSTLCVNTTLTAMIAERRREFALQKALGASHRDITLQIILETTIICTVAIFFGLILGYVLAQILGHAVFDTAIDLRIQVLPITIILSLVAAFIAAIVPTRRAIHIEPAKVLKGE